MELTYDVEVEIHYRASHPFRVPDVESAEHAREIALSFLAAWGVPAHRIASPSELAEQLAETGRYEHIESEYRATITARSGPARRPRT